MSWKQKITLKSGKTIIVRLSDKQMQMTADDYAKMECLFIEDYPAVGMRQIIPKSDIASIDLIQVDD